MDFDTPDYIRKWCTQTNRDLEEWYKWNSIQTCILRRNKLLYILDLL
jgi:hypothetical protein